MFQKNFCPLKGVAEVTGRLVQAWASTQSNRHLMTTAWPRWFRLKAIEVESNCAVSSRAHFSIRWPFYASTVGDQC